MKTNKQAPVKMPISAKLNKGKKLKERIKSKTQPKNSRSKALETAPPETRARPNIKRLKLAIFLCKQQSAENVDKAIKAVISQKLR